ncbi:MAG: orotidine-5'-phosphate decarboxylase [Candidatus Lokiarchaeota archaeon]|nr:orotidine-5'-phosphate decarboxylase [Candidatus Lokiarchaeota archaeon]MBD3341917.1 orotidine-5'-phosphate decarboxylase [Candidatus Lokiarchaeota archaeon]
MMYFVEKLLNSIQEKHSVVCMGLDPRLNQEGEIPTYLIKELEDPSNIITEFNKQLIDKTCDLIAVIKPQIAFYEKYDALDALKETIKYAQKNDLLVILDSKRNDIGSTSKAYADATFKVYGADACTINPFFGYDGIEPYLKHYKQKGLFILVKTSNQSSKEFQNLFSARLENVPDSTFSIRKESVELERNYIHIAKMINRWAIDEKVFLNYHNLGAVVGATHPQELKNLRDVLSNSFILMPGFGAQGATVKDIVNGFHDNGLGGIINSSRGIMFAYNKSKIYSAEKFGEAAREEIIKMNVNINKEINL